MSTEIWEKVPTIVIAAAGLIQIILVLMRRRHPDASSTIPEWTDTYHAKNPHGRRDNIYRFRYKKVGNSWRAYILKIPDLEGRDSSGTTTHRLWDGSMSYVCWDRPVETLKDMQVISHVWADYMQEYIATGRTFR